MIFYLTNIFSNEPHNILFKKTARVYNFDYKPDYGMVFGDYSSGTISLMKKIEYPYSIDKKYKFGLIDKKIFYLNFIHTVRWIDKNNIFFVKTKKDKFSREGIYKYNFFK